MGVNGADLLLISYSLCELLLQLLEALVELLRSLLNYQLTSPKGVLTMNFKFEVRTPLEQRLLR